MRDATFWAWLEAHGPRVIKLEAEVVAWALEVSCRTKAALVTDDEHETGSRALLNLGHTFAHAMEREAGYTDHLLHGGRCLGPGLGVPPVDPHGILFRFGCPSHSSSPV